MLRKEIISKYFIETTVDRGCFLIDGKYYTPAFGVDTMQMLFNEEMALLESMVEEIKKMEV